MISRIAAVAVTLFAIATVTTGCGPRRTVVVVQQPESAGDDGPPHEESRGDAWDGERWVVVQGHVHGPRCGHHHHHGVWHVHPAGHVYVGGRGHHFGVSVRVR